MMNRIKAIFFDFGNVLDIPVDIDEWQVHCNDVAATVGMTGSGLMQYLYGSEAWQKAGHGLITEDEFWHDRLAPLGLTSPEVQQVFHNALLYCRDQINPRMRQLLDALRQDHKIAVLTNTSIRNLADWMATTCDYPHFHEVIGSADVGLMKPNTAIYQYALDRLEVAPHETIFVDDAAQHVQVANALGINGIQFKSVDKLLLALQALGVHAADSMAVSIPA